MEPSNVYRRSILIFHLLNFSGRCTCGLVGKQLSLVSIPPVRRLADSCSQPAHAPVKSQHAAAATNWQQLTKDSCRCWQQCSDQVCSYESGTKSKNFTGVFLENCQDNIRDGESPPCQISRNTVQQGFVTIFYDLTPKFLYTVGI